MGCLTIRPRHEKATMEKLNSSQTCTTQRSPGILTMMHRQRSGGVQPTTRMSFPSGHQKELARSAVDSGKTEKKYVISVDLFLPVLHLFCPFLQDGSPLVRRDQSILHEKQRCSPTIWPQNTSVGKLPILAHAHIYSHYCTISERHSAGA